MSIHSGIAHQCPFYFSEVPTQAVIDTATVPFSLQGDAEFFGNLGTVPTPCANPLFLVRILPSNRWIATGAVRVIGDDDAK
jgi:hypothetical protein